MDVLVKSAQQDDVSALSKLICYPFDSGIHISAISSELFESLDWQLKSNPTILGMCCFYGSVRCVNMLIAMGADVNEGDDNGRLPIHFAAISGNVNVFMILIQKKVDLEAMDLAGVF